MGIACQDFLLKFRLSAECKADCVDPGPDGQDRPSGLFPVKQERGLCLTGRLSEGLEEHPKASKRQNIPALPIMIPNTIRKLKNASRADELFFIFVLFVCELC